MGNLTRLSAASLASIVLDKKFLLEFHSRRNLYIPFGGKFKFDPSVRSFLESIGAQDFGEEGDLAFKIPESSLPTFEKWFYTRKGRETDPYTELVEEMVDILHLFKDLPREAVSQMDLIGNFTEGTHFPGREYPKNLSTKRYLEVFDVGFKEPYASHLINLSKSPDPKVSLVTRKEILSEKADDGRRISDHSRYVIPNIGI